MLPLPVAWIHRAIFAHTIIPELELELPAARAPGIGIGAAWIVQHRAFNCYIGGIIKEDTALRRTAGIFQCEIVEEIQHWINDVLGGLLWQHDCCDVERIEDVNPRACLAIETLRAVVVWHWRRSRHWRRTIVYVDKSARSAEVNCVVSKRVRIANVVFSGSAGFHPRCQRKSRSEDQCYFR